MADMQTFNYSAFLSRSGLEDTLEKVASLVVVAPGGPWLVGGCVRRVLLDQSQDSDFDVAFASETQFEATKARLLGMGMKVYRESDFNVELRGKPEGFKVDIRVQLLCVNSYEDLPAVLETFDFTICQFGYDGTDLVTGPHSLWDLGRKRLVMNKVTFGASTVRRLVKYSRQGFTFCQGTIVSILGEIVANPEVIRGEVEYVD